MENIIMKNITKKLALISILLGLLVSEIAMPIVSNQQAEEIFNLAEQVFPQHFSPASTTQTFPPDWQYYRGPYNNNIYTGINADNSVYVIGGTFGNSPINVGTNKEVLALLQNSVDNSLNQAPTNELFRVQWRSVFDPFANGKEALKLLVPIGWNLSGGMVWNIPSRFGGITRDISVNRPDALVGFEFYPSVPYTWQSNTSFLPPIDSFYGVAGAYVLPRLSAAQYIEQRVLPKLPYSNVATLRFENLPGVAASLQTSIYQGSLADAARARITFSSNGTDFEGEIHVWINYFEQNVGSVIGLLTNWTPERVFMMYAPVGQLDSAIPLLYPMAVSEVINPAWQKAIISVEELRQSGVQENLALTAQLSETISQNSQETFDLISDNFRQQSDANDQVHESYHQYIQGVETYVDPVAGQIELPSGFAQVWSNSGTGEYVLLNDSLFDPNTNANFAGSWNLLQQR